MFTLKNCPKCGGKALVMQDWCCPPYYFIRCSNCNNQTGYYKNKVNAYYEWQGYIKENKMGNTTTIKQIYEYVKKLGLENLPVEFHTESDIFTITEKHLNKNRVYGRTKTYLDDFTGKITKEESLQIIID